MESLNNKDNNNSVANQEGDNQNPSGAQVEPLVKKQSNETTCYDMAHYKHEYWAKIQDKLRPIAYEELVLEKITETISFFMNDAELQSSYCKAYIERNGGLPMENIFAYFFTKLDEQTKIRYQRQLFPSIAQLILNTKDFFPRKQQFPRFTKDDERERYLTREQCACLLAHMVFCINLDQSIDLGQPYAIDFSAIYLKTANFNSLEKKVQKMKCIFTYFEKVLLGPKENREGKVTFERVLKGSRDADRWASCDKIMSKARILSEGKIEDQLGDLQVVFSDKKLGDHVLQIAITQQQIMCLLHPEMMLSILLCEELGADEAVRVHGARRYSNYRGYGETFEFAGAFEGDNNTERFHVIMDACKYRGYQATSQFDVKWLVPELNKAYCGFSQKGDKDKNGRKVATGKWGCGIFKGDPQLKFLIQWMAASKAKRDLDFYSNEDFENFKIAEVNRILDYYDGKEVGELFKDLAKASIDMQTIEEVKKDDKDEEEKKDDNREEAVLQKTLFRVLIAINEKKGS